MARGPIRWMGGPSRCAVAYGVGAVRTGFEYRTWRVGKEEQLQPGRQAGEQRFIAWPRSVDVAEEVETHRHRQHEQRRRGRVGAFVARRIDPRREVFAVHLDELVDVSPQRRLGRVHVRQLDEHRRIPVEHPRPLAEPPVQVVVALGCGAERSDPAQHTLECACALAHQLDEDRLFALEVLIQGGSRRLGQRCDVFDRRVVEAVLGEALESSVDDLLARAGTTTPHHGASRAVAGSARIRLIGHTASFVRRRQTVAGDGADRVSSDVPVRLPHLLGPTAERHRRRLVAGGKRVGRR